MSKNNQLITLLTIGTWIGMVAGISFLEAPLKFQAPGITLALGLGIGKLVFGILNKIEIVFALVLAVMYWGLYKHLNKWHLGTLLSIFVIIAWQSLFLLPVLGHRTEMIIANQPLADSWHHMAYILAEVVKLMMLFFLFIQTFRYSQKENS